MKILLLTIFFLNTILLLGQDNIQSNSEKTRFSLEIDPGTIVMNGFGIHVGINPRHSKKWFTGISAYTLRLPQFAVNISEKNKNMGWKVRIKYGVGIYSEYFFNHINKGWFVASQIGLQKYQLSNVEEDGQTEYTLGLFMPYFGYSWKPFKDVNFYLKPWAGVGYSPFLKGSSSLGLKNYETSNVTPLAALHLGYTF